MLALYIANKNYSSWSLRPWAVLKALGIPFEERLQVFADGPNAPVFSQFSPTSKVPCLHAEGLVVWDSLAIVEFLAERHAGVWPADVAARAWARCAAAEMHSGFATLRNDCSMTVGQRIRMHHLSERLLADIARFDELWCEGLQRFGGPFLAGATFTAVDAFYAPVVFRVRSYGLPVSSIAAAYVEQMLAYPVLMEWEAAALAEPWREAAHEADILAAGELVADYRMAAR
jgi:glutathione S-transferase